MNAITSKQQTGAAALIDARMQDSYLLVVELRQGASAQDIQALGQLCERQVERVRQSLASAGLSQRCIDHISHA